MKDLRRRFERFCLKNRVKGNPNLMLVIAIGNLAVYALSYIDPSNIVYSYLCFSRSAWAAAARASISSSRSPSITLSILYRVSPMRWSVTRPWGKL